ncbi:AAA family ATPase [Mesorhizobium sp. M0808]|uniref:AAA family ATPase n=1 Tax=Mesorhizobium sp. M0808 TaxID=2957002 RepID=UPI00333A43F3
MKLHKLSTFNFMPYNGNMSIDFPTDDYRNVMIVFGDNMRGKTSLLNAIRWGFYGKAIGRHSRQIPLQDIVNKESSLSGDWKVQVYIEFEAGGHKYDLRRTADRRALVAIPTRPDDFIVSVHLTRDGVVISGDQIEAEIDQIAPEQISRFFLFDGELLQEYESLLIEGSEQGRQIREAIEEVLGVPALIKGRDELGTILKAATKKQTADLIHIQGLEKQAVRQKELTAKQDTYDRDLITLVEKLEATRKERLRFEDELEASALVLTQKAKLDGLKRQKTEFSALIERKTIERTELLGAAWQDLLDAKLTVKRTHLLNRQSEINSEVKKHAKLENEIEKLEKLLSTGTCSLCGQKMDESHRHDLGTSLGQLQVEVTKVRNSDRETQAIAAQLAALGKIRGVNAKDRLRAIDRDLGTAEVGQQRTENEIETISDEIAGQDTADLARKRILKDEAVREEGRLQADIDRIRKSIEQTKQDLAVIQKAIEGLASARSKKTTAKVNIASALERTFSASIERLRDRLRERVGKLANDAFLKMTTQKGYRGLEINTNYGLSILDGNGRKVPVRSAGAEQVVALSLIDGLNRTGRSVGPVVMDTPFGRLDLKHRDNILTYLPEVTSQFVLLVHSGEIRPDTDLAAIKPKIGAVYNIVEVSPIHSKIEKATL